MQATEEAAILLVLRYELASTVEDIAAALGFEVARVQEVLDVLEARGIVGSA